MSFLLGCSHLFKTLFSSMATYAMKDANVTKSGAILHVSELIDWTIANFRIDFSSFCRILLIYFTGFLTKKKMENPNFGRMPNFLTHFLNLVYY